MNDHISAAQCLIMMNRSDAGNSNSNHKTEKGDFILMGGEEGKNTGPTTPPAGGTTRGGGVTLLRRRENLHHDQQHEQHQEEILPTRRTTQQQSEKNNHHIMITSPSAGSNKQCHYDHTTNKDEEHREEDKNFILDLFFVISDNQINHNSSIATWLPSGNSFMIVDEYKFASLIIPVLLGEGASMQDFLLELYKWGFESTKPYSPSSTNVLFWHEFFRKGHQDLLHKIVPVCPIALTSTRADNNSSTSFSRSIENTSSSSSFTSSTTSSKANKKEAEPRPQDVSFDGRHMMSGSTINYDSYVSSISTSSSSSRASCKKRRVSFDEEVKNPALSSIPSKNMKRGNKKRRTTKKSVALKSALLSSSSRSTGGAGERKFLIEEEEDPSLSMVSSFERRIKTIKNAVGRASSNYNEEKKRRRLQIKQDPHLYKQVMEARFERFMSNRRQVFFFQKENQPIPDEDEFLQGEKGVFLRTAAYPTSHAKTVIEAALGILHQGKVMDHILDHVTEEM